MNLKLLLTSTLLSTVALQAACSGPADPIEPGPDAGVSEPEPALLGVTVDATRLPILQGTSGSVTVSIDRDPSLTGPVTIVPVGLPPGVTADALEIAAGMTSGTLTLHADAAAAHSLPTRVTVRAVAGTVEAGTELTVTVYGPPGSLDTSFGGGKLMFPAAAGDDYGYAVAIQADGKIVIAGRGGEHLGDFALMRLDRDGNLDTSFGTGGRVLTDFTSTADTAYAIAMQADGKIVVAGTTVGAGTSNDFAVARYLPDGSLDTSFGTGGKVATSLGPDADTAYALLVQPDGKILVGGDSNLGASETGVDFALVRYLANGTLDASFGTGGVVITPIAQFGARDSIYALAFQTIANELRIVAAGGEGGFTLARYHANGTLDVSFDDDGKLLNPLESTIGAARAVAITADNRIVVAGHWHNDFALVQLKTDGSLDPTFSTDGKVITPITTNWDVAQALAIEPDGRIVAAGWAYEGNSSAGNFVVARYTASGELDTEFAGTGIVQTPVAAGSKADQAMAVALQVDDRVPTTRIVAAGYASASNSDFAVTRYWR